MQWHQSQDSFVAELGDGSQLRVMKGDLLPAGHELVRRDADCSGTLFRPLDVGDDDAQPARSPVKGRAVTASSKARP
jgi:hypothetical protein